jgi:(4S)-4-hydroxy-5-phosphonooxypentane-2,3-dione isomerase
MEVCSMLIQCVHFTFAPEDADRVETMLRELRDASRAEAGIVSFEVARSQDDPDVFVLWEVYRDRAALDAHRGAEHFQRLVVNGVRPLAKARTGEILSPI